MWPTFSDDSVAELEITDATVRIPQAKALWPSAPSRVRQTSTHQAGGQSLFPQPGGTLTSIFDGNTERWCDIAVPYAKLRSKARIGRDFAIQSDNALFNLNKDFGINTAVGLNPIVPGLAKSTLQVDESKPPTQSKVYHRERTISDIHGSNHIELESTAFSPIFGRAVLF